MRQDGRQRWARSLKELAWVALIGVNGVLLVVTLAAFVVTAPGYDWSIYVEAGRRAGSPTLFDWSGTYAWSYSPLLAYLFAAIAPIGYWGWALLHFAVLPLLSSGKERWIVALSWPFWVDVYNGNTMTFVAVAAVLAVRGNLAAQACYIALCLLMPRPVMIPVMVWIVWQVQLWRYAFLPIVAAYVGLLALSGLAPAWLDALRDITTAVAASDRDVGPAALIGGTWLPIGVALAVVFLAVRRLGIASLAISPYWLPQYLLMLLLELRRGSSQADAKFGEAPRPSRPRPVPMSRSSDDV